MAVDFRLDHGGIADLLKGGQFAGVVRSAAESIAANVRTARPEADVVVDEYVTDRTAASVTIREPYALLLQARDGLLTRAAANAGLEVSS